MKANKKICIFTTAHAATDVRIFHKEARTLAAAGYEVEIIGRHPKKETIDGVMILPIQPAKNRFSRFFFMPVKMFFRAVGRNADVYHFHDPELVLVGLFLKIFYDKKVIYDSHEDAPRAVFYREWLPEFLKIFVSAGFSAVEKTAARFFDCVICATPVIASRFNIRYAIVLANYPLMLYFKDAPRRESNSKDQIEKNFTVISVGNFEVVRGTMQLVEAIGMTDKKIDASLKIVGKFTEYEFKNKVMCLDGWRKTVFLEWMPLKDVYALIKQSDAGAVCFLPTRVNVNAMPNKIFEYMACGLPVIYSNFPLWENIASGCGIPVDPEKPEEIARAIEYIARNRDRAKEMGKKGEKMVKEVYNWEVEGKKLIDIYRKI